MITITALTLNDLDIFMEYLAVHLAENGQDGAVLFQPLSNRQSTQFTGWKRVFTDGMTKPLYELGWRRVWVAQDEHHNMIGHVDIRSHNQLNTEHRVLLGMGVDRRFRNQKIGQRLVDQVVDFCQNDPHICWIDLQVMANNIPAIRLYQKNNFETLYTTQDMFRIEGASYDFVAMRLWVG